MNNFFENIYNLILKNQKTFAEKSVLYKCISLWLWNKYKS